MLIYDLILDSDCLEKCVRNIEYLGRCDTFSISIKMSENFSLLVWGSLCWALKFNPPFGTQREFKEHCDLIFG